ncbi:hypothetical protein SLEP1_g25800 [Rubroshorea leprosula]|uniref:F-box domain-containing protein n=1 Tax=Rubroshorea leprosula TaxID=152421 RepID=A0AAV5JUH2_9ROSI|nr:hypothetical protein SLEP1_g25800 [Rubroshorea leprosula]
MDAEEEREKKRVKLAGDPLNRAMVQRDLHDLPLDMLLEMLLRLPIASLIHFKTTSRAGYDLIADPGLPLMFRNRVSDSNPSLILFNHNLVGPWPRQLYFVDIEGCSRRVRKIDPPQHSEVDNLVSSYAVRVPPANPFLNQIEVFGFGFHPRTGEFKVIRIVWYEKILTVVDPVLDVEEVGEVDEGFAIVDELMVQVFTVGSGELRLHNLRM